MSRRPPVRNPRAAENIPFLVLPENQLAFSAAVQLRDTHTTRLNPVLTISGASGTGKTHLVSQVFAERRTADCAPQTIEFTADEFVAEWKEAIRSRTVVEMRDLYLSHDTLVCEDLQAFRKSRAAQDAFVSLVDEFLACAGRVVFTASARPRNLRGLSPQLLNRCHGGVTTAIESPGHASRLKLLKHFAAPAQLPVSLDALQLLAEPEGASPRELRGQFRRLLQAAESQRRSVDLDLAKSILAVEPRSEPRRIADVAREVARQFGVTLRELRSQSRVAPARIPRQAAMYLSRQITGASCAEIGAYFSGRSHSTVVYACEQFQRQLTDDPGLTTVADGIRQKLTTQHRRIRVNNPAAKRRASG